MALTEIIASTLASYSPSTLFGLFFLTTTFAYFVFLRKPNLDMPSVVPDKGPEGVFNTLTRMYEKVRSVFTAAPDRPVVLFAEGGANNSLQYPDQPFIMNVDRPIVILPGRLVDDVKNMSEEHISLHAEVKIDHSMAVTKVGGGTYGQELLPTVRIDLTRSTNGAIPAILDEIRFAMDIELRDVGADEWSTKHLHMSVTKISAFFLSRIFIGRPISRSPEWLGSAIGYAMDLMRARHALNKYPYWLRLIIGKYLPEVKQMQTHLARGKKILMPIVQKLVAEKSTSKEPQAWEDKSQLSYMSSDEVVDFDDAQGTFCSWLLKYAVTPPGATEEDIATSLALNQLARKFPVTSSYLRPRKKPR